MHTIINQLITDLRSLQLFKVCQEDRHIKGHSTALLKRLQELNLQDDD